MKYITNEKVEGMKINRAFLQTRNCNVKNGREIGYIVMHYTGNARDNAVNNAKYFANNPVNASAHFFVDEKEICQSVELKDIAWHVGAKKYYNECRNSNSVGIEMCCSGDYKVSEKTIDIAVELCATLCRMFEIKKEEVDRFVVRHYDVTRKNCPKEWTEDERGFIEFKERVKEKLGGKLWDIKGHWAEDDIRSLYEKGILSGYEDGSFKPDNFVTRAELARIINRVK